MSTTLPTISITLEANIKTYEKTGDLEFNYKPFLNLIDDQGLSDFSVSNEDLKLDLNRNVDIEIQPSYDGSVNLILNDGVSRPRLINSRFTVKDDSKFEVIDRNGSLDTNTYKKDNLYIDSSLVKIVQEIPYVDFLGISAGGKLPIGNYTFYFKLSDSDGNETDIIAESGKVLCHIGAVNDPKSIRGGQQNENSQKIVKFKLNNIDLAYKDIVVYYSRSTGDALNESTEVYKILDNFKIKGSSTEIQITGYERFEKVDDSEILTTYNEIESSETMSQAQGMLFLGNLKNNYDVFNELSDLSLRITPSIAMTADIGNLNENYEETSRKQDGYEYYNAKNIYYKLGYWDNEIYRFGIVYILNDYSLSPVFNIRGIQNLSQTTSFNNLQMLNLDKTPNYIKVTDEYFIEGKPLENAKGVFRIDSSVTQFNNISPISPIGLNFKIPQEVIDGARIVEDVNGVPTSVEYRRGLSKLTKGFFIVRQPRLPDVISQGLSIVKSDFGNLPLIPLNSAGAIGFYTQSFLAKDLSANNILTNGSLIAVNDSIVSKSILLCPEANLRKNIFATLFNSSLYSVNYTKFQPTSTSFKYAKGNRYHLLNDLKKNTSTIEPLKTNLTLVEAGTELISSGEVKFSAQAGNETQAWKTSNINRKGIDDLTDDTSSSILTKEMLIRGQYNTYIGLDNEVSYPCRYFNIYKDDYNFEDNWKNYFKIRFNDSSTFTAVSDRFSWERFKSGATIQNSIYKSPAFYRGDCYISTYTHRMNWNFIDPELPTNRNIADKYTWCKNYKIGDITSTNVELTGTSTGTVTNLSYRKILPLFTYKNGNVSTYSGEPSDDDAIANGTIIEPDGKKYKKYSESNGTFGYEKINRVDVNTVPLGQWLTFKICSNYNLAMRDLDFSKPEEEALHKKKRGFFPLQKLDGIDNLPESDIINNGISKTTSNKYYFEIPDVPYLKTNFTNRIIYSDIYNNDMFKNGYQIFRSNNYQDYTMEYGGLVKLVEWYGSLIAVMEHGVMLIPVNERAMMTNASGENVYINTDNVLPKNPKVLSNSYGSLWKDSIVKTPKFIYGLDTVAKKIWRTNGETFEMISDMKVQKFLNDNIKLSQLNSQWSDPAISIKTHYNAYKQDVMFVFNTSTTNWNLCWNEILGKWITYYTWFPEFSENINNIFYTFANTNKHSLAGNKLYKHGFAGTLEETGTIEPSKWYDEPHPFEYEFVVVGPQGVQKIFDNLKIISNSAEPESFIYEISGESYDWSKSREFSIKSKTSNGTDIYDKYKTVLLENDSPNKIPFVDTVVDLNESLQPSSSLPNPLTQSALRGLNFVKNSKGTIETQVYQKACDIKREGRLKGNMQYVEDLWSVQIQPITFKYIYLKNDIPVLSNSNETRIREKYIKIRVRYTGNKLAIITAIKTLFTISYA